MKADFEKLREEFKKHGLTAAKAARGIGRSDNYFSVLKYGGFEIRKPTQILLESVYNIKPEYYMIDDGRPEPKKEELRKVDLNDEFWTRIEKVIYRAAYEAFCVAVKDGFKDC